MWLITQLILLTSNWKPPKFIFILTSIVITKFMFICIWKNMRSINDTLVTRIVIRCCFVIAMVFCLIRAIVQEKQSFLMVSGKTVTENWDSKPASVGTTYLVLFRDYGLHHIFLGIKILFFKIESWNLSICLKKNFVKPHKISTHSAHWAHSDNFYFHFSICCLIELKFCEVSRNSFLNRCWKFHFSILKNKKVSK